MHELGKEWLLMNFFPHLDGLVVTATAQAVDGILFSQSMDPLEVNTLVDYIFILLSQNLILQL